MKRNILIGLAAVAAMVLLAPYFGVGISTQEAPSEKPERVRGRSSGGAALQAIRPRDDDRPLEVLPQRRNSSGESGLSDIEALLNDKQ